MRNAGSATLAGVALVLAGALGDVALAGDTPTDTVSPSDSITLRVRGRRAFDILRRRAELRRMSDGDFADVTYERGKPLLYDEGRSRALVPWSLAAAIADRKAEPLSDAHMRKAERTIQRMERTGSTRALAHSWYSHVWISGPDHAIPSRTDGIHAELRDRRRYLVGDDDAWLAYRDGDTSALEQLTGPDAGLRFRMREDGRSEFQALRHRHVLMHRSRRHVTLFPALPLHAGANDGGLDFDSLYELRIPGRRRLPISAAVSGVGARFSAYGDSLRFRTPDENGNWFPYGHDRNEFLPRAGTQVWMLGVTPPQGEDRVPVDLDWEAPLATGDDQRGPVVRFRMSEPISPEFHARAEITAVEVGTPNERTIRIDVPARGELRQTALGDVVVEVRAIEGTLRPGTRYRFTLTNVRSLTGRDAPRSARGTPWVDFLTEPGTVEEEIRIADFRYGSGGEYWEWWVENTALVPQPASADDPDSLGVVIPDRALPESSYRTSWFRMENAAPTYFWPQDDPATPEIEETVVRQGAPGTSVEIVVRTAPDRPDVGWFPGEPELALATAFTTPEDFESIGDRRWVQFEIRFTVDPNLPEDAELPSVERIVFGSREEP